MLVFSRTDSHPCKMTKDLLEKKGIKAKFVELDKMKKGPEI